MDCHNLDSVDLSNERSENTYSVFRRGPSSEVQSILGGEDFQWKIYVGNEMSYIMETEKKYSLKVIY